MRRTLVFLLLVLSALALGINKERERELEDEVRKYHFPRGYQINPLPPCMKFKTSPDQYIAESDRGAEGHPYSASSAASCELGCRQHLGECYAGWFGDEGGYVLTSIPAQFYCRCCTTCKMKKEL